MKYTIRLIILSFITLLFWSPISVEAKDASAVKQNKTTKYLDIKEIKTKSGLTAWFVQDSSVPVIAMSFSFRGAGAKNDPVGKQGLTRLASNTMDEGAGNLTSQDFQKMLRDKSISLSFSAGRDHFGGSLKTLSANKQDAFHLLKIALTQPRFDQEPLDRMRASNKSRIKSSLSNPRWITARIKNDRIYDNHSYALNSGGTLASLDNITADDLRAFHKTLGKNNLVISVAGDIEEAELQQLLDDVFSSLPETAPYTSQKHALQNSGKTFLHKMDIPQTFINITQTGIARSDKDFYNANVMNFILGESGFGSRLMEEIREKRGLTYGIYSYFNSYDEIDSLHVSTSTGNENVSEMLSLIHDQWDLMTSQNVSTEEINEAKSYLIGSLPLSLTSTNSIAGILQSMQLDNLPMNHLDTRADKINAVGIADVNAVAKRLLDKNKFTTILVGNPEGIDAENLTVIETIPNAE